MNQFEYRSQIETFFGIHVLAKNTLSMKVPWDPSQQKPFSQHQEILSSEKAYLHCPDWAPAKGKTLFVFSMIMAPLL